MKSVVEILAIAVSFGLIYCTRNKPIELHNDEAVLLPGHLDARIGRPDPSKYQSVRDALNWKNPYLIIVYSDHFRAAIEISRKNPTKAIEVLQMAAPYELGEPPPLQLGTLYPVYLRGQAYLLLRQGNEATAEFQKILEHRGIVLNFPLGALVHVGLARACVLAGNTVKAHKAYQDFFALWKDADPDIPILREARTEYTKLK